MKIASLCLLAISTLILSGCPAKTPTTRPSTVGTTSSEAKVTVLRIVPADLKIDHKKRTVRYEPGRDVKRARYTTYHFDYGEFTKVSKGNAALALRVRVTRKSQATVQGGPNEAAPAGGFEISHLQCKILGVAK